MANGDWSLAPDELIVPPGAPLGSPRIAIGQQIPAELTAFYLAHGPNTVVQAILYELDASNYSYTALLNNGARADGTVAAGVVSHFSDLTGASGFTNVEYGRTGPGSLLYDSGFTATFGPGSLLSMVSSGSALSGQPDYTWNGVSQPRGLLRTQAGPLANTSSTAATVQSVSSTTDVACLTITGCIFPDGRAFEIDICFAQTSTLAQSVRHKIRTVSTAGTIIVDYGDVFLNDVASGGEGHTITRQCRNVSGADITEDVLWVIALRSGVTTANVVSRNSVPTYVQARDIGLGSKFPLAKQV